MNNFRRVFLCTTILIQVFAISSCTVFRTVTSVSGRYSAGDGAHYDELILNPDGSSLFNIFYDVGGLYNLQGNWELHHNKVILKKHHLLPKKDSREFLKDTLVENFSKHDYKIIHVYFAQDSSTIGGVDIKINSNYITAPTVAEGYTVIPNMPVESIEASFFGIGKTFFTKDISSNSFDIYLSFKLKETDYIVHDAPIKKWTVRKNKLICTTCHFNKMVLIKQKTN